MDAARLVLELARSRPPTLGNGRLMCIDGPAGSGKTTLADQVAGLAGDAHVVHRVLHMDDLYDGWDGLPHLTDQHDSLLRPLAAGDVGRYRRFDWVANRFAETIEVRPVDLLILEGVGSWSSAHADLVTVLAWVEAPHDLRMRRGIERDGEAFAPHWVRWAAGEKRHFGRHRTREQADVLVDGTDGLPPTLR